MDQKGRGLSMIQITSIACLTTRDGARLLLRCGFKELVPMRRVSDLFSLPITLFTIKCYVSFQQLLSTSRGLKFVFHICLASVPSHS